MHGLGPNHIDSRWVQIIKMYSYSNQTTSNQARWIFVQTTKKFLIQAAKLVQKEAQFNMLIKTHVEELAQQS